MKLSHKDTAAELFRQISDIQTDIQKIFFNSESLMDYRDIYHKERNLKELQTRLSAVALKCHNSLELLNNSFDLNV